MKMRGDTPVDGQINMPFKKNAIEVNRWTNFNSNSTVMDMRLDSNTVEDGFNDREPAHVTGGAD